MWVDIFSSSVSLVSVNSCKTNKQYIQGLAKIVFLIIASGTLSEKQKHLIIVHSLKPFASVS